MEVFWAGSEHPDIKRGIAGFVASHIPGASRGFTDDCVTLGIIKPGENPRLVAGVVYHNYCPETGVIELSAASTDKLWLTRPVLKSMFSYPFEQAGCQMVILRVSERNEPMIRIAHAYGFKSHVIPRLRGRDEAEHVLTLTDDDWRANRFNRQKD